MFAQLLSDTASRSPDQTALIYKEHHWTWNELSDIVRRLNGGFLEYGIQPNQHVALWLENSPCFVFSFLAIVARGAVAVPLNPSMRPGDCPLRPEDVDVVITTPDWSQRCRETLAAKGKLSAVRIFECFDPSYCQDWGLLTRSIEPVDRAASDKALLQYSSGSVGQPKALYRTNGQCVAEVEHFRSMCNITAADTIFGALPLFHAHGLANTLWASVGSGATLLLMDQPSPFSLQAERAVTMLASNKVTLFAGVPEIFQALADHPTEADLSRMRLCFSAGSALPVEVYERFRDRFGLPVRQLYGCTEAGSVSINLENELIMDENSVGRSMPGVDIVIRDDEKRPVLCGEIGEVTLRSPALTSGYVDKKVTEQCFWDQWFYTGDLGYIDCSGNLYLVGRKRFVIHVAGHKVYAEEIEKAIATHLAVRETAVIGFPDERSGETIRAFVVLRSAASVTEGALHDYCTTQLPHFKRPKRIVILADLPKTALGKIARDELHHR